MYELPTDGRRVGRLMYRHSAAFCSQACTVSASERALLATAQQLQPGALIKQTTVGGCGEQNAQPSA